MKQICTKTSSNHAPDKTQTVGLASQHIQGMQ